jgi:excisionase family DNA binding protein
LFYPVKFSLDETGDYDIISIMEKLLTMKEAAQILKINPSTIYRHINNGLLHAVKLGGRTMFKEKDLNKFIRSLPFVKVSKE